jgi:hypothetical protein
MVIRRSPRPAYGFLILRNEVSNDKRLSWAARGMLVYLLSKPDDWNVSIAQLINETKDSGSALGRDGVYKVLNQLIDAGYVKRVSGKSNGQFSGTDYVVMDCSDEPLTDSPLTAFPDTAEPDTANPTLIRTVNIPRTEEVINTVGLSPKTKRIIATHFQNAGIDSLSADWENIGYSKGLTREFIHDQFDRFANYWTAQPNDRKGRKSDWTATWRNWLGKSAEMANRPGRAKTGSASDGGWLDAASQLRDFL